MREARYWGDAMGNAPASDDGAEEGADLMGSQIALVAKTGAQFIEGVGIGFEGGMLEGGKGMLGFFHFQRRDKLPRDLLLDK